MPELSIKQQQISHEYDDSTGALARPSSNTSPEAFPIRLCDAEGCRNHEKLQKCGKCNTARYCSKKCQRDDWHLHKASCNLATISAESNLQRHLRLWTARFNGSLTCAIVPALQLHITPSNIDSQGVIVYLIPRPHREAGSRFTLKSVEVVSMEKIRDTLSYKHGGTAILDEHARQRDRLKQTSGGKDDYATMIVIADNTGDHALPGDACIRDVRFKPIPLPRSLIRSPQFKDPTLAWRETLILQVENDLPNRIVL